jgi:hypothetical protein
MTSVSKATRGVSSDNEFYINIADARTFILENKGTQAAPNLSSAVWSCAPTTAATGVYSSMMVAAAGGLLRDLGKTLVSSGRQFRRVQLVVPQSKLGTTSTFGVAGSSSTATNEDFLTGYIEVGFSESGGLAAGTTTPAPFAKWGR